VIALKPTIAALLAVAAQTGTPPAPDVLIERVPLGTLNIPDEIASAILPYFDCEMASRGVPLGPPGAQTLPPPGRLGADCSEIRARAALRAEAMLRDQRRGTAVERRAFVERVLVNVHSFVAVAGPPPRAPESKPDVAN